MQRDHSPFERFTDVYWSYYRELEDDFLATRKYVSFDPPNYSTYSIEYLKLYQATCSEINVLGKTMANTVNQGFKPDERKNNILEWRLEIQDSFLVSSGQGIAYTEGRPAKKLSEASCLFLGAAELKPWGSFRTKRYKAKNGSMRVHTVDSTVPEW